MLTTSFLVSTSLAAGALAASISSRGVCTVNPVNPLPPPKCNSADPAYTQSEISMYQNIVCPDLPLGSPATVKKPYLLVAGSGTTGKQSWDGSYVQLLGKSGLGFDVCYLAEPKGMLNDAQDTDEHIAYGINTLFSISGQKPIVQGWSQGNLDIQWVLNFWTSARSNTDRFISLAGDFRGTDLTSVINGFGLVFNGTNLRKRKRDIVDERDLALIPLPASIYQQLVGSNYLEALANKGGLQGKVPTTSIFSMTDEIIAPENDTPTATSYLAPTTAGPVGNIYLQAFCPGVKVGHGGELNTNLNFEIVKMAIASPNKFASRDDVTKAVASGALKCNNDPIPGVSPQFGNQAIITAAATIVANVVTLQAVIVEPPVRAYAK